MKELKGACIIGQSGGPTSVINASAYGVIDTALKSGVITQVLGAEHGIKGVLSDRLFDMGLEDPEELRLLKYTPSSALGSCRYKIADPEVDFSMPKFIEDVKRVYAEKGYCIVAVSEGIHYEDGGFVSEAKVAATDGFGHAQLGGLASLLAQVVKEKTGAKVRGIELSLLQRCGAHLASETDIEEAVMSGKAAVENAVNGITDKMVGFERSYEDGQYVCKTKLLPLTDVANTEKKVPIEWINAAHNGVEKPFIDYVLPLIQGEPALPKEDSLPRFAKLKKVLAK